MSNRRKKEREGEKAIKVQTAVSLNLEILLSAHAQTSQANISASGSEGRFCGKFSLFIARQWLENRSTSFKTRFSAKSPGANGLSKLPDSEDF